MAPIPRNVAVEASGCRGSGAPARVWITCLIAITLASASSMTAADSPLQVPEVVTSSADGRLPLQQLLASYLPLVDRGWQLDVVAVSKPTGTEQGLPIIALRTARSGAAVWILTGIHGEEPAGPNALAAAIDDLASLGERVPVVLLPLCNPHGYARNWRYLNMPSFSDVEDGQSVGDSSHLLLDPAEPGRARAAASSSAEADALTSYVIRMASRYPPRISLDLHEDDLIPAGYVYSQGELGGADELAHQAVAVLREHGIPIKLDGQTRFGEDIEGGIIGPVTDSSIDELFSAGKILVGGQLRDGPSARTVLVFETPAKDLPLDRRVAAHLALVRQLAALIATQPER